MPLTPQAALQHILEHRELAHEDMLHIMRLMVQGEIAPTLSAALLAGLRSKKESVGEITAAAMVLREYVERVDIKEHAQGEVDLSHFVDIVGTGGDGARTFNISTATMFVAAAAGATVAKHGNRCVSSSSGSADALEALGANLNLTPADIVACLQATGVGFMFAPHHHPVMKNIATIRHELGVRTLFNILGPLVNPAKAPNQLIGVFNRDLVSLLIRVLQRLGATHALVVFGLDGLDEVSLGGPTLVGELHHGVLREYTIQPEDFGLQRASSRTLRVANPQESKTMLLQALENTPGAARDIVILNAGVALYAANVAATIAEGIERARAAIESGAARATLDAFVKFTQQRKV